MIYDLISINDRFFKYGIKIPMMLDFHTVRQWMSSTYGYSTTIGDVDANEHWSFAIKLNHYVIYIKGDEELSWFKIKHGETL
jgi:hypothetical protein